MSIFSNAPRARCSSSFRTCHSVAQIGPFCKPVFAFSNAPSSACLDLFLLRKQQKNLHAAMRHLLFTLPSTCFVGRRRCAHTSVPCRARSAIFYDRFCARARLTTAARRLLPMPALHACARQISDDACDDIDALASREFPAHCISAPDFCLYLAF